MPTSRHMQPVFGSRVRSLQPYNVNFHLHENYELYLLIDGQLDYFVEQTCYRLTPGSLILFDNKTIHKCSNSTENPYERVTVHFHPQLARHLGTGKTNLLACFDNIEEHGCILQLSAKEMEVYLDLADRIVRTYHDRLLGADVLQHAYLMELLVFVNRCFNERKAVQRNDTPVNIVGSRLRPLLEYIEDHLADDLSLEALSAGLSLSKSTISHIFKEETGSTPSRYITTRRIALAKHLLRSGCSVTEACMQSGFNDYANFIRVFKASTGVPPGQYRKDALSATEY